MPKIDWELLSFIVVVLSGVGAFFLGFARTISFFSNMGTKVDNTHDNVKLILHNHLPHIYERLGEYEVRQDQAGNSRRDRINTANIRLDSDESSISDGGLFGSVENSK